MPEAEAMQYVALHTPVPVPKVKEFNTADSYSHIFMSKADGEPLGDV